MKNKDILFYVTLKNDKQPKKLYGVVSSISSNITKYEMILVDMETKEFFVKSIEEIEYRGRDINE